MKKLTHGYFKLILLCGFGIGISTCKKADITSSSALNCHAEKQENSKSAAYQDLIEEYKRKGLPGIQLLIEDSTGQFVGAAGFADIEKGIPMEACHVAKTASVTKMVVAVLTFMLQEEGALSIEDPITKYLTNDELEGIANAKQVSIKDLLRHSTGIYDVITDNGFYLQVLNDPTKKWEPQELLEFVRGKEALFPANSSASYSNTNYLLLSMILKKATGSEVNKLLRNKIFDPLGMDDTYYHWHDELPENRVAQGYFDLYQNQKLINLSNWNTGSGNGYGGMYSTVLDLHKFAKALFVDKILLSDNSMSQMLTFNKEIIESRKYLGVGIFKDFIDLKEGFFAYGHRGRDLAYSADLFYFPATKTIMALEVNYGNDSESDLRPVFLEFRDKIAWIIAEM